jgi:site-specific recombinase XerD
MTDQSQLSLDQIFEAHLQTLALTLRPATVRTSRLVARGFLGYLQAAFPQVCQPAQLQRDPHLLGWLHSLCQRKPPLRNTTRKTYVVRLRGLLEDLAANGHPLQPNLIRRDDFPRPEHYLPRPLSLEDDQLLQNELRRTDDLLSNALLLTRATGIRIGECIDLPSDCLRRLGQDHWALHVPLGKLHTERLVPADTEVQRIVARILQLRALAPTRTSLRSEGLLLSYGTHDTLYKQLSETLSGAARRAGCSTHVNPHRLRHTYASEMLRLGISLPALMLLLGHKDIRMTLRYAEVTQQDLQREFYQARRNATQPHRLPKLPTPKDTLSADLPGIRRALAATRHLMEMYRRNLPDDKARRKLQRLARRLLAVADQLGHVAPPEK